MEEVENWHHGSFNLCVPVVVGGWKRRQQPGERVLLRFPLPCRVGDAFRPGNGDEKVRCEAGAYAWLEENCPDVPIPKLYGFSTSTGETVRFLTATNVPCGLMRMDSSVYSITKPTVSQLLLSLHTYVAGFFMAWPSCPYTVCPSPICQPHIW